MTAESATVLVSSSRRWLTRAEVCQRLGISRSTSYRLLPEPARFGPRTMRWAIEVVEAIEAAAAQGGG